MSTENSTEKHLQIILNKIRIGNVALFLGAGASHFAGGPTGKKLTALVKKQFPLSDIASDNFLDVCQDIIETPPYDRNQLENFIRTNLEILQPSNSHKILTQYDWPAIFTTNYDDLIETSYRLNTNVRLKTCHAFYIDKPEVNISDKSKVYLFKIMGSILANENDQGSMVLTRSDLSHSFTRRKEYYRLLLDFIKSGTIVFIGYSFEDRVVLDIMDELFKIHSKDRLPWSFALYNKLGTLDEKARYKFSSRKIIPLECSFDSFFDYLNKNYEAPQVKIATKNIHLKVRGYTFEITSDEANNYFEYFNFLNEEAIYLTTGDKDGFFMGTNSNWEAFREGWDFKREIYTSTTYERKHNKKTFKGCIRDKIFEELNDIDVISNKVILINGMGGSGKTTLLKRLAYDIYTSGEAPVILINTTIRNLDYKLISSFIENINHQYNKLINKKKPGRPIKPVIIIDDAASLMKHVNTLKDYLASRGRPAIIVAAERSGEWQLMWELFKFKLDDENVFAVDEYLTAIEKKEIVSHFHDLGYIKNKELSWDNIIDKEFENSYFATIYTLVHPSKKPLNEIIQTQYAELSELSKTSFEYICSFHQFDIPINYELLVRSLKCTYEDFKKYVIDKDTDKIIFEDQDASGNLLYRSHHRIIAKKTMEYFFSDPEMQKNLFLQIFSNAVLSNRIERLICVKLVVDYLGPNAKYGFFTADQKRQMFEKICEENEIRTLIHHWGVLESDERNFLKAEELLKKALNIPRDSIESYRGESDQNIQNSLGTLYSHNGIAFLDKGDQIGAEENFKLAEQYFKNAKHGEFPNIYAYHSHAFMWYLRGEKNKDPIESNFYYSKALQIIETAKDNLNIEELEVILELESKTWNGIGDKIEIEKTVEVLRDKFGSARGYYLNAQYVMHNADSESSDKREELLRLSLRKIEKGLKHFPNDEHCLRLKCKLLKDLHIDDLQFYFEVLSKWKAVSTIPNARLVYELGRTAFILGYYEISDNCFKELETGIGIGNKLRSIPRDPILNEKGELENFEGQIVKIFSSYVGRIKCESLRSLKDSIVFRPIACKFTVNTGDMVAFNIKFSFRGPRSENVRKI